eukprot:TRINITY_DN24757_c1_g1_i1.p1 TRINITY_DN24757_c1_g1~~TRINITY_DN24757_c1_g1_i1.p1  ORF type:complete len:463 (+),score=51.85 TRINITY_DN24757_c1_g1_i1:41-1429(+)
MAPITKPHVAILSFPFGTHATPLLFLSLNLASSAPHVSFSFFGTPKSNASLPSISSSWPTISNLKIYDVGDGVPEGYVFKGKPQEDIELYLSAAPGNYEEAMEEAVRRENSNVSCIVGDSFLWFAVQMAEKLEVPWVSFWTSGACSLSAHFYTDLIRRTISTVPEEVSPRMGEALTFVPGFSNFRVSDLPEGIVFGRLTSPFSELLHRMGQELPRAAAVVINTVEGLDPTTVLDDLRASFQKCLPVGPVSLLNMTRPDSEPEPDPHSCISWLDSFADSPASVAYVSFGTVMSPPPSELAELAEGLEASGAHFLWSLRDKHRESLPAGFLDRTNGRGLVVPWAPQTRLLGHVAVGAFVTHCGWNSLIESAVAGVPMICRPFFGDQRINGRMLSDVLGVAIRVEGGALTREIVTDGLDLLLRRPEGKKIREKAQSLKALTLNAVSETGSSTNNLKTVLEIITRG